MISSDSLLSSFLILLLFRVIEGLGLACTREHHRPAEEAPKL